MEKLDNMGSQRVIAAVGSRIETWEAIERSLGPVE